MADHWYALRFDFKVTNCHECPLQDKRGTCIPGQWECVQYLNSRPRWCPLVEVESPLYKHGS